MTFQKACASGRLTLKLNRRNSKKYEKFKSNCRIDPTVKSLRSQRTSNPSAEATHSFVPSVFYKPIDEATSSSVRTFPIWQPSTDGPLPASWYYYAGLSLTRKVNEDTIEISHLTKTKARPDKGFHRSRGKCGKESKAEVVMWQIYFSTHEIGITNGRN